MLAPVASRTITWRLEPTYTVRSTIPGREFSSEEPWASSRTRSGRATPLTAPRAGGDPPARLVRASPCRDAAARRSGPARRLGPGQWLGRVHRGGDRVGAASRGLGGPGGSEMTCYAGCFAANACGCLL